MKLRTDLICVLIRHIPEQAANGCRDEQKSREQVDRHVDATKCFFFFFNYPAVPCIGLSVSSDDDHLLPGICSAVEGAVISVLIELIEERRHVGAAGRKPDGDIV